MPCLGASIRARSSSSLRRSSLYSFLWSLFSSAIGFIISYKRPECYKFYYYQRKEPLYIPELLNSGSDSQFGFGEGFKFIKKKIPRCRLRAERHGKLRDDGFCFAGDNSADTFCTACNIFIFPQ